MDKICKHDGDTKFEVVIFYLMMCECGIVFLDGECEERDGKLFSTPLTAKQLRKVIEDIYQRRGEDLLIDFERAIKGLDRH